MPRAASIGLGWRSNRLAAAIQGKSHKIGIVSCFTDACAGKAAFRVRPEEAIHTVAEMQAIATSAAEVGRAVKIAV
jgi:hypothetical protein